TTILLLAAMGRRRDNSHASRGNLVELPLYVGPVELRLTLLGTPDRGLYLGTGAGRCHSRDIRCSLVAPLSSRAIKAITANGLLNEWHRQFTGDHGELLHTGNLFDAGLGTPSEIGIRHIPQDPARFRRPLQLATIK